MVSIKEVAARCGVSRATVSKALNGYIDVNESTKEKVMNVAKEMGYVPNSVARALKTNRSYNVGVLFTDGTRSGLTHEYFSGVLESFKAEAECKGYDVTFINDNIGCSNMSYLEHCQYRGVDGVCIACVDFNSTGVVELVNSSIPVVTIDHLFNNKSAIVSDNILGIHDLVDYIHSMGHTKIAYIHGEITAVTEKRMISFHKTLEDYGLVVPDEYVRQGLFHSPEVTANITRELLELPNRPTCIIFPDDFSAIGGINVIRESGLSIPEDISIAGYDGILLSKVLSPKLTTYKQDTKILGKKAAELLINHIEKPKTTIPETILVKGEILKGGSVGQLR
jgi:DNA-binding LacI/PurR family transcriptional regulator